MTPSGSGHYLKLIFRIKPATLWLILEILKILIQTIGCCAHNFQRRIGCFGIICPENNFESGFTGFPGLQRTSSFLAQCLFVEDYFIPFFSPLRYAAARGLVMKAPFNDKIPTQTNDVIVNPRNPENPDSNQWQLRAKFSPKNESLVFYFSYNRRAGILSRWLLPFQGLLALQPIFIAYMLPRILQCISPKYQIQDLLDLLFVAY